MRVAGVSISASCIADAVAGFEGQTFTLRDFQAALETGGLDRSVSYEAAKRQLQRFRRNGHAHFDMATRRWCVSPVWGLETTKIAKLSPTSVYEKPASGVFGNLLGSSPTEPRILGNSENLRSEFDSRPEIPTHRWFRLLGVPICLASVGALAAINAIFVWDFVGQESLKWALLAGFLASDFLRPLLVAVIFFQRFDLGIWRGLFRRSLALSVVLALSPLSLFSSVSVLSAAFQSGQDQIAWQENQRQQRERLEDQYAQEMLQVERLGALYTEECRRGGCGTVAEAIYAKQRDARAEAEKTLADIAALSSSPSETTSLSARTIRSLATAGISFEQQRFLIPLLMALTLEVAALFGPALLLTRGRGKPKRTSKIVATSGRV